ncbi:MAG: NADH-ubiquinone oxidoreductase-F iron-sulfur binding region domain-containing protein [Dehalococcoidia bacterium]
MATYQDLRQTAETVWKAVDQPEQPVLQVDISTSSLAHGANATLTALKAAVESRGLDCSVGITGYMGISFEEPMVTVTLPGGARLVYGNVTADKVPAFVDSAVAGVPVEGCTVWSLRGSVPGIQPIEQHVFWRYQVRRLMAVCGIIDPENIDHAIANRAYEGLARTLQLTPDEVIKQVLDSGLWGRGGAVFPTGRKWDFLKTARRTPKYIVCNADEGDPGAFVNRTLMEGDPHPILEGIAIAGYAGGAEVGYIYIRDEYPLAVARVMHGVAQARERGLLGANIFGSGFSFDIRVTRGAGSYVCGEETGLISSIQDSRGMPRIKPPFPANAGLWGLPTNVNNVETLANAPIVMRDGPTVYRQQGTEKNSGTKMLSLTGDLQRVGTLEVPFGTPLKAVVYENGGGLPPGRTLKGIQPGGPLGGIMPAAGIEVKLEPEPFRDFGVLMGGGGYVLLDDTTCMVDLCNYFTWFAEDESCGRCTTCHGGTQRLTEILRRIQDGGGRMGDIDLMHMIGDTLRWSNCVHGQAAPTCVQNCLKNFLDEFLVHIKEKRCPAQVCRGLIRYEVVAEHDRDAGLARAAAVCPTNAVRESGGRYAIDQTLCIKCDACREQCPTAIQVVDAYPTASSNDARIIERLPLAALQAPVAVPAD